MAILTTVPIKIIQPHPLQPPSRCRDTTDLQASHKVCGRIRRPIVFPDGDGGYVAVAGHRNLAAARQAGHKKIEVEVWPELADDPVRQVAVLCHSNIHRGNTHLEKARIAQWLLGKEGKTRRAAAAVLGVSLTEMHYLISLLEAPPEIQGMVQRGDMGRDGGLTWGAFKEISNLPPEVQIERISEGATRKDIKKAKLKAGAEDNQQPRLVEDTDRVLQVISQMRDGAGEVLVFLRTATPDANALVFEALTPFMELMGDLWLLKGG